MKAYLELLKHIKNNGEEKGDRTGTGTLSVFGYQMRFNLSSGFPLVTTKKMFTKAIIYELLWFLRGGTSIGYLNDHGVHIWDEWADKCGYLGPIYGYQWRRWNNLTYVPEQDYWLEKMYGSGRSKNDPIDQIKNAIGQIKNKPNSRRIIVSAWNVADINKMALPPCHCLFQFYVAGNRLSCQLYQRSADVFLGVPFNIASYALLTLMVAQVTGLEPGEFIHTFGDTHIYLNHLEQVDLQLSRKPYPLPTMELNPEVKSIFNFKYEDFNLKNYRCHPAIKAPIAV